MAWGFPFISLFVLTTNILSGLPKKSLKRLAPYKSPACVCACARSVTVMSNSCDLMDSSMPDSFVLGIFQARILEWVAISFSRGSSWPKDQTPVFRVSCIGRQILYHWAHGKPITPFTQGSNSSPPKFLLCWANFHICSNTCQILQKFPKYFSRPASKMELCRTLVACL